MKRRTVLFAPLILLLFASCSTTMNLLEIENTLKQTDLDFSTTSQAKGLKEAFLEYAGDHAVLLREGQYPIRGKPAIKEFLENNDYRQLLLSWQPIFAEAAGSGDLGYTYGTYEVRERGNSGELISSGSYVTIWKKQPDGSWKFVMDTGTEGLGE